MVLKNKTLTFSICAGLFACLALFTNCARVSRTSGPVISRTVLFYVATNGNDAWSGTFDRPRAHHDDGPFQTIERALQAATDLKDLQGGEWKQRVAIIIRGGTYWLEKPLVISPRCSGTAQTTFIVRAYRNEHPIISAGRPVSGWKAVNVSGKKLWAAIVPTDARCPMFHQLWVNGERRVRARHPNRRYLAIAGLPDATASWESGHQRFQFKAGDLKSWLSATNGEAIAMTRWVDSRLPITGLDEANNILSSSNRTVFQLQPGDPYYVEHIFEVLDEPGEWYFDQKSETLYYAPLANENIDGFVAVIPKLEECLRVEGRDEDNSFVEHVTVRGLTFSHNEWYYPANFGSTERHISSTPDPQIYGSAQAAFVVPGAVRLERARDCVFEDCTFSNLGSYGVQIARACRSNRLEGCTVSDVAAGGIRIGETLLRSVDEMTRDNEVVDCHVSDGGKMFHSGIGIWIGQSPGNRISHNCIHDFYYTGISIGWTWGYEPSGASNNIVEYNHVHHIGAKANGDGPILSDMGGIYTLGMQPGTVISNNVWHDIRGLRYGGWGIYFDEGSSGIVAEKNVVYRTTHGGFHQHYGKENIVRNNVFAFGRDAQLQRTRAEDHSSFSFSNNIVYFNEGKLFEGDWSGGKFIQNSNLYFDTRTNTGAYLNFPGGWDGWRKSGHDVLSLIADPRITGTNIAQLKFLPDSPASSVGFRAIDLSSVGPKHQPCCK